MSTSFCCVSWKPASGRSNCSRSSAYAQRRLEAVAGGAERAPHDAVARLVEARERPAQPARVGKQRGCRQPHVVEVQLGLDRRPHRQLRLDRRRRGSPARRSARRSPRTPSSVCAQTTATCAIEASPIHRFAPVEHPVVAVAAGEGLHARRVGAGARLGEPEAADHLALRHPRQPLLLLLLAAVPVDRAHRERALHRDERAQPGVAGLELQGGEAVLHGAAAGASVALEVHAEHAERRRTPGRARGEVRRARTSRRCAGGSRRRRTRAPGRGCDLVGAQQGVDAEDVGCRAQRADVFGVACGHGVLLVEPLHTILPLRVVARGHERLGLSCVAVKGRGDFDLCGPGTSSPGRFLPSVSRPPPRTSPRRSRCPCRASRAARPRG